MRIGLKPPLYNMAVKQALGGRERTIKTPQLKGVAIERGGWRVLGEFTGFREIVRPDVGGGGKPGIKFQ